MCSLRVRHLHCVSQGQRSGRSGRDTYVYWTKSESYPAADLPFPALACLASRNRKHMYIPFSRFSEEGQEQVKATHDEACEIVASWQQDGNKKHMQGWMSRRSNDLQRSAQLPLRRIPTVHVNEKDIFSTLWTAGLPIVVDHIYLTNVWKDRHLSETYGEDPCVAVDEMGQEVPMTVKRFFELWAADEGVISIRVRSTGSSAALQNRIFDHIFRIGHPLGVWRR